MSSEGGWGEIDKTTCISIDDAIRLVQLASNFQFDFAQIEESSDLLAAMERDIARLSAGGPAGCLTVPFPDAAFCISRCVIISHRHAISHCVIIALPPYHIPAWLVH